MKTIEYIPSGMAVADVRAEEMAKEFLLSEKDTYIGVSTDNFITAIRCLIHEGVYDHANVQFLFEGQTISPDKNGRLPSWPAGFCDVTEQLLVRLLKTYQTSQRDQVLLRGKYEDPFGR